VPYWSEALLVLPRDREPVLVVALTYRVKSWIERTSRVAEVIHSPRVGLEAARLIAGGRPMPRLGSPISTASRRNRRRSARGRPALALRDATALFAALRAGRSGGDRARDHGRLDRAARARAASGRGRGWGT
jgi:hypothetical protein